ncbi:MAG: CaiB/BaiF CoA-transferase family protein [Caldilineaceae bacterium]
MTAPLAHLKILDFSTLLPGPYATMLLADLGAEIIRVEAPGQPELTRLMPPFGADGQSAYHAVLNRSKRSLGLNLKAAGAVEIVQKLVAEQGYNIVVEQFRPGVMARLGVGYAALKARCPHLIYCSLTGYGQTGPYRDRAGHDLNYLALSGLLSYYGRDYAEDGADVVTPPPLPMQVADVGAGSLHLVIGLLAAVIRRSVTGEGGMVDIAMHDGALAWNNLGAATALVGGVSPTPESTLLNGGSFYDLYTTKDDRLLAVGSLEPHFWQGFCQAIGRADLVPQGLTFGLSQQRVLKEEIRAVIRAKTLEEWSAIFAEHDVCVEPVLTTAEALDHPQTQARHMVVDVPLAAGGVQPQVGAPIKISNHTPHYRFTGPTPGAHTHEILTELGYNASAIDAFYQDGVVAS